MNTYSGMCVEDVQYRNKSHLYSAELALLLYTILQLSCLFPPRQPLPSSREQH